MIISGATQKPMAVGWTPGAPAPEEAVTDNKKPKKEEGSAGAEERVLSEQPVSPINYQSGLFDAQFILDMLQQKWDFIQTILDRFKPSKSESKEEEEVAEEEFQEKQELKKQEEATYYVAQQTERAIEDMQALLACLSLPTDPNAGPAARAAMVLGELQRISGVIGGLLGELEDAALALAQLDTSQFTPEMQESYDALMDSLNKLNGTLMGITSACQDLQNQFEAA